MLGARTAFSDYISVLGGKLVSAVLSVVSVLITARLLQPADFGIVAFFVVVALLLFTVTSAWTTTAIARYGREEIENDGNVVELTWARAIISLPLLCLSICAIVALQAGGVMPSSFTWSLIWLAVAYGTALVISDHLIYSLEAAGGMKESAIWTITQQVTIVSTFAVILFAGEGVDATGVARIYVAWSGLFAFALCLRMWRLALWRPRWNRALARKVVRFSRPMIAFTASQYLIRSVDLFILGLFAGAAATGLYAIAYQSYTVLQGLTIATGPVLVPLFVSLRTAGREEVIAHYFDRVIAQMTLAAAVLGGFAASLVGLALPILFGDAFADAVVPLTVLLLAVVIIFVANLLAPIMVLHERTHEIGVINALAAAANIALDLVLIGVLDIGIVAPAIATVVSTLIILVGYSGVAARCLDSPPPRRLAAMMLPLAAGMIPCLALATPAGWALSVVLVVLVAVVVTVTARPFSSSDAELISRLDMPQPLKRLMIRTVRLGS